MRWASRLSLCDLGVVGAVSQLLKQVWKLVNTSERLLLTFRKTVRMEWKVFRSHIVFRDQWISVRADDCITPSGVEIAPFYLLEYPDWVHVAAIDTEDHVLLVRQFRRGYGGPTLELPGGVVDAADNDPLTAAVRELMEETGYTGESLRLLASLSPNLATHTNRVHVVLAHPARGVGHATPEPSENITLVRVLAADAAAMALGGNWLMPST
jgi:8-oxo-dGTP pyrophosphatase MutT (NUDIX family)